MTLMRVDSFINPLSIHILLSLRKALELRNLKNVDSWRKDVIEKSKFVF